MSKDVTHRLLLAASEVVGFAKTGGLADVAGALPRALAQRGHECAVILPLYRGIRTGKVPVLRTEHTFTVALADRNVTGRLWQGTLPDSAVQVYLIEQADYYDRDNPADGQGIYQFTLPNGQKRDYADNCERFIFFCRAILEALPLIDYWPDVLHLNDWQTGLVPIYLHEEYRTRPNYDRIRTLLTIHNLAYQGIFWHWDMPLTGLDWRLFNSKQLEYHGRLNFLKAGIVFADQITTVSPTYAREIQTPQYGCGLEGVLAERHDRVVGIVNGVDYSTWNPATDPRLAATYAVSSFEAGKVKCKAGLQRRFGLKDDARTVMLGVVSRLVEQKGLSLLSETADAILQDGAQLVVLGEGDAFYHRMLLELRERYPQQVGLTLGFDETLAHQVEAGADIFLMPSQFEPSGLNQLYSLKYGTVPVVRATGGLADTITDCTAETLEAGTATGFTFGPFAPAAFLETVRKAIELYRHHPENWRQLVRTGMEQDWSWNRSAAEYERLYTRVRESAVTG
jgi:starch synthase